MVLYIVYKLRVHTILNKTLTYFLLSVTVVVLLYIVTQTSFVQSQTQNAPILTPQPPPEDTGYMEALKNIGSVLANPLVMVTKLMSGIVSTLLLNTSALIMSMSGFIFENSIYYGVVIMSQLVNYGADGGPSVVVQVWTIIRDVLNIAVIFVILYLAIRIIIGQGEDIKKIISGVILFGVLTNFSLFFVKGAVDLSNVIALEFYQALRTKPLNETVMLGGITSTILTQTKVNAFFLVGQSQNPETAGGTVLGSPDDEGSSKNDGVLKGSITYQLSLVITLLCFSFLFIRASFMFLSRFIILVGVMVFSPLMFAGGLFTPLKGKIEEWWGAFTSQLFFAPVFFILLYVAVFLMGGIVDTFDKFASTENTYIATFVSVIIVNVIIIMAFNFVLNTASKFSSDLGNKTADWGGKMLGKGIGLAGGAALGGAAIGMRRAAKFAGVDNFADRANTSNTWKGKVARGLGVGKLKDATFDLRNSTIAQKGTSKVLGALNSATGGSLNDVASISLGRGSRATLGQEKTQQERKDDKEKVKQNLYNSRAQARIDLELKKVEDNLDIKEHDVTDESIYSYDNNGNRVPLTRLAGVDDKAWEKNVKQANGQNKQYIYKQKEAHLASRVVTTADARKSNEAMARYRANQGARKALDGSAAAKLQKYTTELTGDGTPANPGYLNILGRTDMEVRSASNEDLKAYWGTIEDHFKSEVAIIKRTSPTGNVGDIPTQQGKDDYQKAKKMETRAKGAAKEIDNLRKTLEEESKKK